MCALAPGYEGLMSKTWLPAPANLVALNPNPQNPRGKKVEGAPIVVICVDEAKGTFEMYDANGKNAASARHASGDIVSALSQMGSALRNS